MKAVAYLRVSTSEQVTEGYSLAAQERAIRAYCEAHKWELIEVYADEGCSGSSMKGRESLQRLLADAAAGRFDRVIFWKLDRLGRSLRDLLQISDELEAAGVGIVSIQEAIDTGTAAGRMMRSVLGALAEFEREVIVSRIQAGIEEKAKSGELVGPLLLGYQRDEAGSVVLDDATAPSIHEAFERYATGQHSLREMGEWATSVGLKSSEGNLLDRLSMRKLLTNVAYRGDVSFHARAGDGFTVKGRHPAIVDEEVFDKVQVVLASRRRNTAPSRPFGRQPYPLSGVATCGSCNAPLLGAATVTGAYRYRHMRCSTAHRRGKEACRQKMVRAEILEAHLGAYVTGMRLPPEYLGAVVKELRKRQGTTVDAAEVKRLARQSERWKRLFVLGEIDEKRYKQESMPLRQRLDELERPPQALDVERALLYLRDVGALWADSSHLVQRKFVREVFDRIVVNGKEITAITPKPLFAPLFVIDRQERFEGDFCSMAPRARLELAT